MLEIFLSIDFPLFFSFFSPDKQINHGWNFSFLFFTSFRLIKFVNRKIREQVLTNCESIYYESVNVLRIVLRCYYYPIDLAHNRILAWLIHCVGVPFFQPGLNFSVRTITNFHTHLSNIHFPNINAKIVFIKWKECKLILSTWKCLLEQVFGRCLKKDEPKKGWDFDVHVADRNTCAGIFAQDYYAWHGHIMS